MEKFSSMIVGTVKILDKTYDAELIKDSLVVRTKHFLKEINSIINTVVEFVPVGKGEPIYYLYIDNNNGYYYSYMSYHVLLLYRHFIGTKEIGFEIISKGFTNSVNTPRRNLDDPFYNIRENLEKEFLQTDVCICDKKYKAYFINHGIIKQNNLCPADFFTGLKLVPNDGVFIDKIFDIYNFANKFLQFITLNTYSMIDNFVIYNESGGYSDIEIFADFSELDNKNDRFLYLKDLGKDINKVINAFPSAMTRQHNLYHYKRGWVFEFDIVRLSGTFEGVFRENIEKEPKYNLIVKQKKDEIHYDELSKLLKDFAKKYKIEANDDYSACTTMFRIYAGTLKNKLEYILEDFCKTMDMVIIDSPFMALYSAMEFESRIKDSRNSICHGLNKKPIDWNRIGNDTLLLQELVYYMLLKYKLKLTNKQVKNILDESFGNLNLTLSFYKKDDSRIKWKDEV